MNRSNQQLFGVGLAVVLGFTVATINVRANADIDNGLVQLGINDEGDLVNSDSDIGLTFLPTGGEALAPGCPCEGWGVADATSGLTGHAGQSSGNSANLSIVSFTSTASTAISVVSIKDTNDVDALLVTHDYHPSMSTNLFECTVTVSNLTSAAVNLRYRRAMDWDVPPTEFAEFVTIGRGNASALLFSSDDGFAEPDPLAGPSSVRPETVNANVKDNGPDDHGALFDFGFGSLAAGASKTFHIYYGASANEAGAIAAVKVVHGEVFSFGQPSSTDGASLGVPNTFIFAFAGVGGSPITDFSAGSGCIDSAIQLVQSLDLAASKKRPLINELRAIGLAVNRQNSRAVRKNCESLVKKVNQLLARGLIDSSTASSLTSCCGS